MEILPNVANDVSCQYEMNQDIKQAFYQNVFSFCVIIKLLAHKKRFRHVDINAMTETNEMSFFGIIQIEVFT